MCAAVQSLLSLGADTTIKHNEGITPLHYAAAYGYVEVIQLLAEWQRQLGSAPRLPLQHQAALHGPGPEEIEMARSFWTRWQEFLDSQDNDGDTPLHKASKQGHQNAAEALIRLGADTTIRNGEGKTAMEAEGEELSSEEEEYIYNDITDEFYASSASDNDDEDDVYDDS